MATTINFTSTTGTGYLETDHDQVEGLLESGTHIAVTFDTAEFKIDSVEVTATATELNLLDGVNASTAEINYLVGVTSLVQTQLDSKQDETETLTAGESLVAGDICYLKSDGKYWKTDADAEATSKGQIRMSLATISADATGLFSREGYTWTTSGLTAGSTYYLSTTAGSKTVTAPSATGDIIRPIGYARSTTVFVFEPSQTYIEHS